MKLISLNIWGGNRLRESLTDFLTAHSSTTDIFCFQEVPHTPPEQQHKTDPTLGDNCLENVRKLLPDFETYYAPTHSGFNWRPVDFDLSFGNAIFVRKGLEVREEGHVFVHRQKNEIIMEELLESNWFSLPRLVQFVSINDPRGVLSVCNFHGLWHTSGKGDMPERFEQSTKIIELLNTLEGRKILCGDFNLDIGSQSLSMIEEKARMRDLIKDFKITTTRSELYPKRDIMPFADYTLVSPDIEVKKFEVPDIPVSDHLPMILEFN
jgi:endonuclease/exonuclease/phosphatase family metal-dependent hydrolase